MERCHFNRQLRGKRTQRESLAPLMEQAGVLLVLTVTTVVLLIVLSCCYAVCKPDDGRPKQLNRYGMEV